MFLRQVKANYYLLRKQSLILRAFVNLWFIFFADWLVNIPGTSSTNQKRQTMIQVTDEIYSGSGTKQLLRISYNKTSIQTLKRRLESCYSWFFLCSIHVKGCLRRKIFPPKNLEKYGRPKYACANFFLLKKKSKF